MNYWYGPSCMNSRLHHGVVDEGRTTRTYLPPESNDLGYLELEWEFKVDFD